MCSLSAADAALVRRDPDLPGLATLLDPDAFAGALRAALPRVELEGATSTYVRYKPATSCLIAYRLDVGGAPIDVHAVAYRRDAQDKLDKARTSPAVGGPLGPGRLVLDDQAVVVSVFPNDGKMPALVRLAEPQDRARLLRKRVPDRPDLWECAVERLRYKPERRYVARLAGEDGARAVLRVYTEGGYPAARWNAAAFRSRGTLRLARRLGRSSRHRTLVLEWLDGRPLSECLVEPGAPMAAVGAALAELHAQEPETLPVRARAAEAEALQAVAGAVGAVSPHLAGRARALAEALASGLEEAPPASRPIHGDFHPEQVLLAGDGIALLDLDEAVRGDPTADLGNFIAYLEREALRGNLTADHVERLAGELLDGYAQTAHRPHAAQLAQHTAAGLLRLAPLPFRNREPDWPERVEALIERAEVIRPARTPPPPLSPRGRGASRAGDRALRQPPPLPSWRWREATGGWGGEGSLPPLLSQALDLQEMQPRLAHALRGLGGSEERLHLQAVRLTRHKPGRRCLIEYDLEVERADAPVEKLTVIGKVRVRGLDEETFRLARALWNSGFDAHSGHGTSVPEPLGVIPELHMWLQRKVAGEPATRLLGGPGGVALARRIAEAAHLLHAAGIRTSRRHTMVDELRILEDRLGQVAGMRPAWGPRLERVLDACRRLGASVPETRVWGIHRDFYPDQVLVDGERLWLLDLDLYCEGDPALDIGNFIGHVTEQSLRTLAGPSALAAVEEVLEDRFAELAGEAVRPAVRAYTTLTLARHIYLSTQFTERRTFTEDLLDLCERRLGIPGRATAGKPTGLAAAYAVGSSHEEGKR